MTKNNNNWKDIEEEFERVFARWHDVDGLVKPKVLEFFKPYFQELEEKAWMYDQLCK